VAPAGDMGVAAVIFSVIMIGPEKSPTKNLKTHRAVTAEDTRKYSCPTQLMKTSKPSCTNTILYRYLYLDLDISPSIA